MGKRTKEHRKKVAVRNQRLVNERRVFDKQMDESVDQVMVRSTSEKGAEKAASLRKAQQAERNRILKELCGTPSTIRNGPFQSTDKF